MRVFRSLTGLPSLSSAFQAVSDESHVRHGRSVHSRPHPSNRRLMQRGARDPTSILRSVRQSIFTGTPRSPRRTSETLRLTELVHHRPPAKQRLTQEQRLARCSDYSLSRTGDTKYHRRTGQSIRTGQIYRPSARRRHRWTTSNAVERRNCRV